MENDKPFKTVEVLDSRTSQPCKVACMSCIRGHRSTSCGIPVCRNKVFWTVKRPGRPSSSCTCRYGSTGGCKCASSRPVCPHKSKKGEKRSGECRCDEQGRYCCLLEPVHWTAIMRLEKPMVDFHPSREALEAAHAVSTPDTAPATPAPSVNSPQPLGSMAGTPVMQPLQGFSSPQHVLQSPQTSIITPRFGMMGLGAPQGSLEVITPDLLSWQGQSPEAPRTFQQQYEPEQTQGSCCHGSSAPQRQSHPQYPPHPMQPGLPPPSSLDDFSHIPPAMSMSDQFVPVTPTFDFNKLSNDYLAYQFPSAICQTCGLSGCTCRNCPPVMQNFNTGSWAQCCGRKHARTATYIPANVPAAFDLPPKPSAIPPPDASGVKMQDGQDLVALQQSDIMPTLQSPSGDFDFSLFDGDSAFALPTDKNELDLSEMLMSDLDRPPEGGCCCGGP